MKLKNVRLTLANVARTTNAKTLEAIEAGTIKEKDENGNWTDKIIGYTVDCSAYKGDTLKVKLPISAEKKIAELQKELGDDKTVNVSFTGLKLTPYAMKAADGSVLSGVSAKAEDFTIESSTEDEIILDI